MHILQYFFVAFLEHQQKYSVFKKRPKMLQASNTP